MPWNGNKCGKIQDDENLKASIPTTDFDRSKTTEEYGNFQLLSSMITNYARCIHEIKYRIATTTAD
jgi:hypothetical protein